MLDTLTVGTRDTLIQNLMLVFHIKFSLNLFIFIYFNWNEPYLNTTAISNSTQNSHFNE